MKLFKLLLTILFPYFIVFGQTRNNDFQQIGQQYILGDIQLSGDHNIDKKSILKLMDII